MAYVKLYGLLICIFMWVANANAQINTDPVCEIIDDHFKTIFKSNDNKTNIDYKNPEIQLMPWQEMEELGKDKGHTMQEYTLKSITLDGADSKFRIVDFTRWFSWKGEIFSIYVIEDHDYSYLKQDIEASNRGFQSTYLPDFKIYPIDKSSQYDWFSGNERVFFKYRNSAYLILEDGKFETNKKVYRVNNEKKLELACDINIYNQNRTKIQFSEFKFISSFLKSASNIFHSEGHCGQSNPEVYAASHASAALKKALYRPWVFVESGWNAKRNEEFQRNHFDNWQYKDAWTKREKDTFSELHDDVITELSKYYQETFKYSGDVALSNAKKAIDILPSYYYSLGYYSQDKNFSHFKKMAEGTFNDWNALQKLIESKKLNNPYSEFNRGVLSLFVDNPQGLLNIKQGFNLNESITLYGKTLLMFAAHMDNYESVKWLVENGADVHATTLVEDDNCKAITVKRQNRSALTYAAENASIYVIKYLLNSGANIHILDSEGNTLDFYLNKNPRFTNEEKKLGLAELIKSYGELDKPSPTFNCSASLNYIETSICKSGTLSIYDKQILKEYKSARDNSERPEVIKASQIRWIKKRNKECGKIKDGEAVNVCLAQSARARLRYLYFIQNKEGVRY